MEAERAVSRWYTRYANILARTGELDAAHRCLELAKVKQSHATALQAWVELIE